jgi:molecular chaperone GrpE
VSTKGDGEDDDLPAASPGAKGAPDAGAGAVEPADQPSAGGKGPAGDTPTADEVDSLRREVSELRESLLRRRADFENYRRRVEREREAASTEAEAEVLRRLLGTVDNLERALAAGGAETGLRDGVALTLRELLAMLESAGVVALDPAGQRFDPAYHQAILHEPAAGVEPGAIAEVFRKGYTYKDRLLRPALVKVASSDSESAGNDGGEVH